MRSVDFDGKNSLTDLGVILEQFTISPPEPKTYKVEITGADGSIDLSEALTNGDIKYKNRKLTFTFSMLGDDRKILSAYTKLMDALHGRRFEHIVLSDDAGYYYTGRVTAEKLTAEALKGTITVQCDVEPYKYNWGDDWLWDPFDFENDIANETADLTVNGKLHYTYVGLRKKYVPYFVADAAMTVTFHGVTYQLSEGTNKIFDIEFCEGENVLIFNGQGTVTIENRGGRL